jgi:hypothetical protein
MTSSSSPKGNAGIGFNLLRIFFNFKKFLKSTITNTPVEQPRLEEGEDS